MLLFSSIYMFGKSDLLVTFSLDSLTGFQFLFFFFEKIALFSLIVCPLCLENTFLTYSAQVKHANKEME